MLRFIFIIMILVVIMKISQDNPYVGFGMYFFLSVGFMYYTINIVDRDEEELRAKRRKSAAIYDNYYYTINSQ